jgi:hypothetical protein
VTALEKKALLVAPAALFADATDADFPDGVARSEAVAAMDLSDGLTALASCGFLIVVRA